MVGHIPSENDSINNLNSSFLNELAANPGESTRLEFHYASSHSQTNRRLLKLELSVEARPSHVTVGWGMRMGFGFLSLDALWVGLLMTSALTRYGR